MRYRAWCLLDKWRSLPRDYANGSNPMQEPEAHANSLSTVDEGAASDSDRRKLSNKRADEDNQPRGRKQTVEEQEAEGM